MIVVKNTCSMYQQIKAVEQIFFPKSEIMGVSQLTGLEINPTCDVWLPVVQGNFATEQIIWRFISIILHKMNG